MMKQALYCAICASFTAFSCAAFSAAIAVPVGLAVGVSVTLGSGLAGPMPAADVGAPIRASFFTPLCLTVGALQETVGGSYSNNVTVNRYNGYIRGTNVQI